jgi:hypothetical protein
MCAARLLPAFFTVFKTHEKIYRDLVIATGVELVVVEGSVHGSRDDIMSRDRTMDVVHDDGEEDMEQANDIEDDNADLEVVEEEELNADGEGEGGRGQGRGSGRGSDRARAVNDPLSPSNSSRAYSAAVAIARMAASRAVQPGIVKLALLDLLRLCCSRAALQRQRRRVQAGTADSSGGAVGVGSEDCVEGCRGEARRKRSRSGRDTKSDHSSSPGERLYLIRVRNRTHFSIIT